MNSDTKTQSEMTATNWKPFVKNSLRGYFSLRLVSGMIIHGCSLFEKNDARWIALPSKRYPKKDGSEGFELLIEFSDREKANRFRDMALDALDRLRKDDHHEPVSDGPREPSGVVF